MVIGASRGIGAATVRKYRDEGYTVVGTHRGTGVEDGVHGLLVDVTDRASVRTAVKSVAKDFGRLDVLVYNAGVVRQDLLIRMREEDLRHVIDTNLIGAFFAVQEALLSMSKQRSGSIVLVSSESSRTGIPGASHYTASKAGLEGFARSAMRECASRNITVNVVAPGPTDTDMLAKVDPESFARLMADTPLGRPAQPAEIAEAIFAISRLTYMTGACVPVTGGEGLGY
jgi:NAD(P)-dependent dehydrogenase (short-subunit alcohol dehydrogenase family)